MSTSFIDPPDEPSLSYRLAGFTLTSPPRRALNFIRLVSADLRFGRPRPTAPDINPSVHIVAKMHPQTATCSSADAEGLSSIFISPRDHKLRGCYLRETGL